MAPTVAPAVMSTGAGSRSHRGWATSAVSGAAETLPSDLDALGSHAQDCRGGSGPMFEARCVAESMVGLIAPRIVTTAIAVVLVLGVISLLT